MTVYFASVEGLSHTSIHRCNKKLLNLFFNFIVGGTLHSNITVLSYSRYCRYRATLKRLEHIEDNQIRINLIETLSGFVASQPNTRIMFAKETIDYPDLECHEMLCPHLAPKLTRTRGRRKKIRNRVSECSSPAPSSEFSVDSCETNDSDVFDGKHLVIFDFSFEMNPFAYYLFVLQDKDQGFTKERSTPHEKCKKVRVHPVGSLHHPLDWSRFKTTLAHHSLQAI